MHFHSEFAFDETDWKPEPRLETEPQDKFRKYEDVNDVDSVNSRVRRMSFVLKSTDSGGNSSLSDTEYHLSQNLLSPPALTLTFPTPEIQETSTLPDPLSLIPISTLQVSLPLQPQTPPRRSLGNTYDSLLPPTPMPALPRCTSCGFGFTFDATGSPGTLSRPISGTQPCDKCQDQWNRCRNWYGKRGWEMDMLADQDNSDTKISKSRTGFERASRRLSEAVQGVFGAERAPGQLATNLSPLRAVSKRLSLLKRVKEDIRSADGRCELWDDLDLRDATARGENSSFLAPLSSVELTQYRTHATENTNQSQRPPAVKFFPRGPRKDVLLGVFSKPNVPKKGDAEKLSQPRRHSFFDFRSRRRPTQTVQHNSFRRSCPWETTAAELPY
ncbi:hypothetical protein GYMLUDRAFT_442841 [Collybiopsis luxurians FD-317 M1]|uniref:Uncharacterized protein n=1 Tax=Collybiopsis luxurians FD-317 M1 TaxID=944289 RepID=A0A0D0C650_9AGAR|nr:hypothetical protein GYMLUDRAFT_442841 [Collybiopsis luxurians FD-317 M1]